MLKKPLGEREYPKGFVVPTWTEENWMVLAFWRVLSFNQLTIEGLKGSFPSLKWSSDDLDRLTPRIPHIWTARRWKSLCFQSLLYCRFPQDK